MIDNMGRLEIPLYHGTSSYFLSQIKEHGLGGCRDQKIFDEKVLSNLANALDNNQNATEWWEFNSYIVRAMIDQRVTGGGFNFRYGNTYLTPSTSTAYRYATSNCLGSEFLTTIYQAYMALATINPGEAERILPKCHCLWSVFQAKHIPTIITLKSVTAEELRTEKGEPIDEQLKSMVSMCNAIPDREPELLLQQFNFELGGSIDWSRLEVNILDGSDQC